MGVIPCCLAAIWRAISYRPAAHDEWHPFPSSSLILDSNAPLMSAGQAIAFPATNCEMALGDVQFASYLIGSYNSLHFYPRMTELLPVILRERTVIQLVIQLGRRYWISSSSRPERLPRETLEAVPMKHVK